MMIEVVAIDTIRPRHHRQFATVSVTDIGRDRRQRWHYQVVATKIVIEEIEEMRDVAVTEKETGETTDVATETKIAVREIVTLMTMTGVSSVDATVVARTKRNVVILAKTRARIVIATENVEEGETETKEMVKQK